MTNEQLSEISVQMYQLAESVRSMFDEFSEGTNEIVRRNAPSMAGDLVNGFTVKTKGAHTFRRSAYKHWYAPAGGVNADAQHFRVAFDGSLMVEEGVGTLINWEPDFTDALPRVYVSLRAVPVSNVAKAATVDVVKDGAVVLTRLGDLEDSRTWVDEMVEAAFRSFLGYVFMEKALSAAGKRTDGS